MPVLAPFGAMLTQLAADAGSTQLIKGRSTGSRTANRGHDLANVLANADPHCVRAESTRLRQTWLVVHLACGTPLTQLLRIANLTSATACDTLLRYVPATGRNPHTPWTAGDLSVPEPVQRTPQAQVRAAEAMAYGQTRRRRARA